MSELIDIKGPSYAKMVATDIEKILKSEYPKQTKEDIDMLKVLAKKIVSKNWVADAQVSSDDFMSCDIER